MKKITLTKGMESIVDDEDFDLYGSMEWIRQPRLERIFVRRWFHVNIINILINYCQVALFERTGAQRWC